MVDVWLLFSLVIPFVEVTDGMVLAAFSYNIFVSNNYAPGFDPNPY